MINTLWDCCVVDPTCVLVASLLSRDSREGAVTSSFYFWFGFVWFYFIIADFLSDKQFTFVLLFFFFPSAFNRLLHLLKFGQQANILSCFIAVLFVCFYFFHLKSLWWSFKAEASRLVFYYYLYFVMPEDADFGQEHHCSRNSTWISLLPRGRFLH